MSERLAELVTARPVWYYFLDFAFCVKADPATDLTFAGVFGLAKSFAAVDATFLLVVSFFLLAMIDPSSVALEQLDHVIVLSHHSIACLIE